MFFAPKRKYDEKCMAKVEHRRGDVI